MFPHAQTKSGRFVCYHRPGQQVLIPHGDQLEYRFGPRKTYDMPESWYFMPNDVVWLAYNSVSSYTVAFASEAEALEAAEAWEHLLDSTGGDIGVLPDGTWDCLVKCVLTGYDSEACEWMDYICACESEHEALAMFRDSRVYKPTITGVHISSRLRIGDKRVRSNRNRKEDHSVASLND